MTTVAHESQGLLNATPATHYTASLYHTNEEEDFHAADNETFELRHAEAQLAATEDRLDQMWRDEQYWTVNKILPDSYSNPNDPRIHVPQRCHYGDRFVVNTARNNDHANMTKKQLAADKQLVSALRKRNANFAKQRNSGKTPTDADRVTFLVRRGMDYCRDQWNAVLERLQQHQRVLDSIVADPRNWYLGKRCFVKGPWYFAPDDYRWKIDNCDRHLDEMTENTKTLDSTFYNHHCGRGNGVETFRAMRLRAEFEALMKEKKQLEAAISQLMA